MQAPETTPRPAPVPPTAERRLPIGAEILCGGVHFRVWAPARERVDVVLEPAGAGGERQTFRLEREEGGYHSALVAVAREGTLYRYRLDGGEAYPDPASRFQPDGPHGPSQVIDPARFAWSDDEWKGIGAAGQVIYEMHIGTFTREGTWRAASAQLPALAELGVTCLEVMPIAEFPGRFGWGYDGVDLFAPAHEYGTPDDVRRFVDRAHSLGMGVILDVVYNHLGPDGNYLKEFGPGYFSDRHTTDWGEAINFDGADAGPVREFFTANAAYWVAEFHFDGLRLDATQNIYDDSEPHIVAEVARAVREAARGRRTFIVAENEPQDSRLVRPPAQGGWGLDALWNDDFHHSATVALTGRNEAYYHDHLGVPQEFISAVKWGYLFQGQRYRWQGKRRGTPALDLPPVAFVNFLQNHDQVANTPRGARVHELASPGSLRALTALTLLAPQTPMLFQGQEFAASSPFLYFADHRLELARRVWEGRRTFLAQFESWARPEVQAIIPDPADPETFERSKLDHAERERHAAIYALHRDLLALRREDPVLRAQRPRAVDGAVLGGSAFVLRVFDGEEGDRLLVVNLGRDIRLQPAPEPLLAPPAGMRWRTYWSSEDPRYGGAGTPQLEDEEEGWRIPGESAVVLRPGTI
ncbi:MAG TPA: malto-oligosyltrehalose trehalohydrolase [Gemmatimonadaceae bacterium]|nr:malto-oligosyltrehalose trehalohydrolase [Gemmatimonadaceae bacterium]